MINRTILQDLYIVAPRNFALKVIKTAPIQTIEKTTDIVIDISSNDPVDRNLNNYNFTLIKLE